MLFKDFFNKAPDIIGKASQSPLALASLIVLVFGIVRAFLIRIAAGTLKLLAFPIISSVFPGFLL